MPDLTQGRVLITNWHVFEPKGLQIGGTGARVIKAGKPVPITETFTVAGKTTSLRGRQYITAEVLEARVAAGDLRILNDKTEKNGRRTVKVTGTAYVESDTALVNRILGREVGGKQNILVMNDEAHHAYRIQRADDGDDEDEDDSEEDEDYFVKEATVWVDGLDRINKLRGHQFLHRSVGDPVFHRPGRFGDQHDFSVGGKRFRPDRRHRVGAGQDPAIGRARYDRREVPGYFNIWHWILEG